MSASYGPTIKAHDPADVSPAISARPDGHLEIHGLNLRGLIFMAHASSSIVTPGQVVDGPSWLDSERFDIEVDGEGDPVGPDGFTARTLSMLQKLIADRFKVAVRPGSRELQFWELGVSAPQKLGPNLGSFGGGGGGGARAMMESGELVDVINPDPTRGLGWQRHISINDGVATIDVRAKGVTMNEVALHLALSPLNAPVIDRTGLKGKFTIKGLRYAQTDTRTVPTDKHLAADAQRVAGRAAAAPDAKADAAALAKALAEQLGLTLKQTKGSVDVLVVEAAERPSLN
jgi:uncharacterized protein (TIGR03435 family)